MHYTQKTMSHVYTECMTVLYAKLDEVEKETPIDPQVHLRAITDDPWVFALLCRDLYLIRWNLVESIAQTWWIHKTTCRCAPYDGGCILNQL